MDAQEETLLFPGFEKNWLRTRWLAQKEPFCDHEEMCLRTKPSLPAGQSKKTNVVKLNQSSLLSQGTINMLL